MKLNKKKILMSLLAASTLFSLTTANAITANELDEENEVVQEETANEQIEETNVVKEPVAAATLETITPMSEGVSVLVADSTTLGDAFPDANFRTYIAETVLGKAAGSYDETTVLTTENITKITTGTTNLDVSSKNITSLEGIQHFTKLKVLDARSNLLTGDLDLTNLLDLTTVFVFNNALETLDVSNLSALKTLYCDNNQLTSLNVTGASELEVLRANANKLESLDTTSLGKLTQIQVQNNNLQTLDVANFGTSMTILRADNNPLTGEYDLTHLTGLTEVYLYLTQIEKLDVSNLPALITLQCYTSQLTELNVTRATNLQTLVASTNNLESVDVSSLDKLTNLQVAYNQLTKLDVSNMESLTTLLVHGNSELTELNIAESAKSKLITFHYFYTGLSTLDLSGFTSLTTVSITKATNADLSKVKSMYVSGSKEFGEAMIRLSGTPSFISWDATTTYYAIESGKDVKYAVGIPYIDSDGTLQMLVSSYTALDTGGLMDNEGNLILNVTLDDIVDGAIVLENGGTIVTGDGTYTFEGSASIEDGVITTESNYTFAKNTATYDEETNTATANMGDIVTSVEVGNGVTTINSIGGDSTVPSGSVITNNDGDKIYAIDEATIDSEGNVTSKDKTITVPSDQAGDVITNGTEITFPENVIVNDGDTSITYPGTIIYDTEDNTIQYLPVDGLFNEDGTLKEGVTQEDIISSQDFVNGLDDSTLKSELQNKVEEAQTQLDERNAEKAVEDLFDEDGNIKDTVTQEDIDNAKDLVDNLQEGDKKTELQEKLEEAQNQLNEKDAEKAIEDLFDNDGNIKDTVTQEDIDNAQDLVNKVTDKDKKKELQDKLDEAQKQFDEKNFVILEEFKIFTGEGTVYTKIDAPVEKFSKVYVDGKELDASNYEVTSGSTVVTLSEAYLKTLANGTYDVNVEFTSGAVVETKLTVNVSNNPSTNPTNPTTDIPTISKPSVNPNGTSTSGVNTVNTGDQTNMILLYGLLISSLLGAIIVTKKRKVQ